MSSLVVAAVSAANLGWGVYSLLSPDYTAAGVASNFAIALLGSIIALKD